MGDKKQKVTISKQYERKINLSSVSSKYDNITLGSVISKEIEINGEGDLKRELALLRDLVFEETEKDIREAFTILLKMHGEKKDLMETGKPLEIDKAIDKGGDPLPVKKDQGKEIKNHKVGPLKKEKEKEKSKSKSRSVKKVIKTKTKKEKSLSIEEEGDPFDDFFGNIEMNVVSDDLTEKEEVLSDILSSKQLNLDEVEMSDFNVDDFNTN